MKSNKGPNRLEVFAGQKCSQIFEYNNGTGYDVMSNSEIIIHMPNTPNKDIVADAPWRINPGSQIPLLFEIKDMSG